MTGKTHVAFGALFAAVGLPVVNRVAGLDFSGSEMLVGTAIGTVAGILPDIDHSEGSLTHGKIPLKFLRKFGFLMTAAIWILSIPIRVIGHWIRLGVSHRGPTHSFVFAVGWSLLAAPLYAGAAVVAGIILSSFLDTVRHVVPALHASWITSTGQMAHVMAHYILGNIVLIALSVLFGYLAHLYSDGLTKQRVPLMWPFNEKRYTTAFTKAMICVTDDRKEHIIYRPFARATALIAIGGLIIFPSVQHFLASRNGQTSTTPAATTTVSHPKTTPAAAPGRPFHYGPWGPVTGYVERTIAYQEEWR